MVYAYFCRRIVMINPMMQAFDLMPRVGNYTQLSSCIFEHRLGPLIPEHPLVSIP
jgi:hypothetical protein